MQIHAKKCKNIQKRSLSLKKQKQKDMERREENNKQASNYIFALCGHKGLQYCLDYAIWLTLNDHDLERVQELLKQKFI